MGSPQAQELAQQLEAFGESLKKIGAGRARTVGVAISARRSGVSPLRKFLDQFESARVSTLQAARALDQQLEEVRKADYPTWVRAMGEFNKAAQKMPGANISSVSIEELVLSSLPAIPPALFAAQESAATQSAVQTELARYDVRGPNQLKGLGFIPVALFSGSACFTAAAAATVATGGLGAVGLIACAVIAVAVVVAAAVVAWPLVKGVWARLNPQQAQADALSDALKQGQETCKERKLSADQCAVLLGDITKGVNDPPNTGIPWGIVGPVAAVAAVWFFWPVIMGKARAARAALPA
jgi:hypothetical protein